MQELGSKYSNFHPHLGSRPQFGLGECKFALYLQYLVSSNTATMCTQEPDQKQSQRSIGRFKSYCGPVSFSIHFKPFQTVAPYLASLPKYFLGIVENVTSFCSFLIFTTSNSWSGHILTPHCLCPGSWHKNSCLNYLKNFSIDLLISSLTLFYCFYNRAYEQSLHQLTTVLLNKISFITIWWKR